MNMLFRPLFALCVATTSVPTLQAAFDPASVSADALWVAHLDFADLRASTLGKEMISQIEASGAQDAFAEAGFKLDINRVLELVTSLTAYGSNFSADPSLIDGTLVIRGSAELRRIAEALAVQASLVDPKKVIEITDLPFDAYSLEGEVFIGFPTEPVIIVSKSRPQLVRGRDVLRGAAPSLARTPASKIAALIPKTGGGFALAASVVPPDKLGLPDSPQARILALTDAAVFSLGERNGLTSANLQLQAANDSSAEKLQKIVSGMTALLSLAEPNDRVAGEFLKSIAVAQEGKTVNVQLSYSSERLLNMIRSAEGEPLPPPALSPQFGTVLAEWKLAGAPAGTPQPVISRAGAVIPVANPVFTSHVIPSATLAPGATLTIVGRREGSTAPVIVDAVEITSLAPGSQPLRFEAENMRLAGYAVPRLPGGAPPPTHITLRSQQGTALFQFPGAAGQYRIEVIYADESEGKSLLSVSLKPPGAR